VGQFEQSIPQGLKLCSSMACYGTLRLRSGQAHEVVPLQNKPKLTHYQRTDWIAQALGKLINFTVQLFPSAQGEGVRLNCCSFLEPNGMGG